MMKTLKVVGILLLILISALSVAYLNYCPDAFAQPGYLLDQSELTDVKISKFIVESLKKVVITTF